MNSELHPSTQLIERNIDTFKGKILVINPVEIDSLHILEQALPKENLTVSCQDFGLYEAASKLGFTANFETHCADTAAFDQTIIFLPKSDLEIEMVLSWASACTTPNGQVILIGQNNAGIKSAKKTLGRLIGAVTESDAARHSALYVATKTTSLKPFSLDDWWQSFDIPATPLHIFTLPGVFSHGRLDEGTTMFLESLSEPIQAKHMLDWGCGAGSIGFYLSLKHQNTTIDMADNNALALAAAKKTAAENTIGNVHIFPTDVFSNVAEHYDFIFANPPFHKGHDTSYTAVENFLAGVKDHLHEHGHVRLVANIFLRYEHYLEKYFGYVKTIQKSTKYKILEAVKEQPKTQPTRSKKKPDKRARTTDLLTDIDQLDEIDIVDEEE